MINNDFEELRKLQEQCIRLHYNEIDIDKFIKSFKVFVVSLPALYKQRGYSDSLAKELSINAIKEIGVNIALLNNEDSFDEGKKNISQYLISICKELTS